MLISALVNFAEESNRLLPTFGKEYYIRRGLMLCDVGEAGHCYRITRAVFSQLTEIIGKNLFHAVVSLILF